YASAAPRDLHSFPTRRSSDLWLEDATPAENQKSFELIRQHSVTALAVGEVFNSIWDCKHLIENQLIDYIRTTIVHGGGISHVRRSEEHTSELQSRENLVCRLL